MSANKKFNKVVGLSLTALGLTLCGFGLYFTLNPITLADVERAMPSEQYVKNCSAAVTKIGFTATTDGKSVTAKSDSLENPQELLTKSSLAISLCEGLKLQSFCMGQGCLNAKISFKLKSASAP
jgi:hypothetical protein